MTHQVYANIQWPSPQGSSTQPKWTGRGFDVDGEIRNVLVTELGSSGWSDELGKLINAEVAPDRPLGLASRRHALDALARADCAGAGKVVLEVGSANGYMLSDIAERFPGTAVIGSDYASPPLAALSRTLPDVPLIQLDVVNSGLPDNFCDAIVMLNVLEHIEDDRKALEQIRRMLKPNGLFIIEVPSSPSLYDDFDRLVGHFRRYNMGDLLSKLNTAGFTIEKKSHLGFFAFPALWALVQAKKTAKGSRNLTADDILKSRIKVGRRSHAQEFMFALETSLRAHIPMPFGVRCLVTARA